MIGQKIDDRNASEASGSQTEAPGRAAGRKLGNGQGHQLVGARGVAIRAAIRGSRRDRARIMLSRVGSRELS
jgi:hypothetical protein